MENSYHISYFSDNRFIQSFWGNVGDCDRYYEPIVLSRFRQWERAIDCR